MPKFIIINVSDTNIVLISVKIEIDIDLLSYFSQAYSIKRKIDSAPVMNCKHVFMTGQQYNYNTFISNSR